uniref:Uncharacterized protein n=1 Tax=Poecilia latipinna TaxID=48699 RepID=A0A3B3U8I9_9TELE
ITRDASFRARDAFISPSAAITFILADGAALRLTLALASRLASASAAMALCSCRGSFTSLISTRSTLIPQSCVASRPQSWTIFGDSWTLCAAYSVAIEKKSRTCPGRTQS